MAILAGTTTEGSGASGTGAVEKAQAQQVEALQSGTVEAVHMYLASPAATSLQIGIFADSAGKPGTLLGEATLATPTTGENTVTGLSVKVVKGTTYWLGWVPVGGAAKWHQGGAATSTVRKSTGKVVKLSSVGEAWGATEALGIVGIWATGAEEEGSTGLVKPQGIVLIGASAKAAATGSTASAVGVKLTTSTKIVALAAVRPSTSVQITSTGKLAASVAFKPTALVIIGASAGVTTAGGIGELKSVTVVKVISSARLIATVRVLPITTVKISKNFPFFGEGNANAVIVTTVAFGLATPVTIRTSVHTTVAAHVSATALVRLAGTATVTAPGVVRERLRVTVSVVHPAPLTITVKASQQIPVKVTASQQIPVRVTTYP